MGLKATGATRKQHGPGSKGSRGSKPMGAGGGRPAGRRLPASPRRDVAQAAPAQPFDRAAATLDMRAAVRATVEGLRYELVDVERVPRGLLRVTIDRRPGQAYASPGEAITVDDCEAVTRQLQYALEVECVDYARLEVSSPGLDRPLRTEADYERFCGLAVDLTLKVPFQGRKHFQGLLGRGPAGWQLTVAEGSRDKGEQGEQVLTFALDEVREARLVPVLDFKGRGRRSEDNEGSK